MNGITLEVGSDGNDWSGTIIWRMNGNRVEVLVIKYTKGGRLSIRFPGGCCAGNDETPLDALPNEIAQELDLELISSAGVLHCWTNKKVPGRHHQHFFATPWSNLQGTLRTIDYDDDDEVLSPPFWMTIDHRIFQTLFFSHRQGLEHALPVIAATNQDFCLAVQDFLS